MKTFLILATCLVYAIRTGATAACTHGAFIPHADCSKFYRCNWGSKIEIDCPPGLQFNPAVSVCDWPDNVECTSGTNPASPNACDSSPCVNGVCYESSTTTSGYTCSCATGYTGDRCQTTADDKCASNPCVRGTCYSGTFTFTCTCPVNYGGDRCQYYVGSTYCNPNPCQNSGQCTESTSNSNGFICSCVGSYTGTRCETPSSGNTEVLCASNLPGTNCLNGGACAWYYGYYCSCLSSYTGPRCETPVGTTNAVCNSNPCVNGGVCSPSTSGYTCACPSNYLGNNCETYNYCSSTPCNNGGVCYNEVSNYRCACPDNYSGQRCDTYTGTTDPCATQPCQNNGICVRDAATSSTYTCACQLNYSGNLCQFFTPANPCESNPCGTGGSCLQTTGGNFQCQCFSAYSGERCETYTNPCDSNPCGIGGASCTPTGSSFFCSCKEGYSGFRCEFENFCAGKTCSNNGVCTSQSTGYQCTCNDGFIGENCEYTNFCASNPCINGTCYNDVNNYRCGCPFGFAGNPCRDCSSLWQCASNRNAYIVPDPMDDTKYIICQDGAKITIDCSVGQKFIPMKIQCE
ncbi:fibropellin-1 isoform X7 [Patella vulgata]|uniref:fibropellin-1 isoform X7 n=1 Tax=Patella vulgata TaxID=6465 RepID=UPI0021805995|nr:fibropellin-1 isoform X7 [Patella vulgata]